MNTKALKIALIGILLFVGVFLLIRLQTDMQRSAEPAQQFLTEQRPRIETQIALTNQP